VSQLELELQQTALGIALMPQKIIQYNSSVGATGGGFTSHQQYLNSKLKFLTLEKNCIKIWEYQAGNVDLIKKIQIKQIIKQCIVAELTGYLLILGENGKVLILD
jgi:hypothetical protein